MKKIILLSSVVFFSALALSSCIKSVNVGTNENYWLSKERGDVVYSDSYCNYYVVETAYGYTIIRNVGNSYRPYEGSILYGDFGAYGTRDFYNYSTGVIVRGEVVETDLSYVDAQYAVDYYCPYAKTSGAKIMKSAAANNKMTRVATQASDK